MGEHNSQTENKKTSKKWLVILLSITALIGLGVGGYFYFNPYINFDTAQAEKDIRLAPCCRQFKVGEYKFKFIVKDISPDSETVKDSSGLTYTTTVTLSCSTYRVEDLKVTAEYIGDNSQGYTLKEVTCGKHYTLTAVSGFDEDLAIKKATELYGKATIRSHSTVLSKGEDTIRMAVNSAKNNGIITMHYIFDSVEGWILTEINDDNISKKAQHTKTLKEGSNQLFSNPAVRNIMLFGTDADYDPRRSDAIILLSIDGNNNELKLTSFMRDTYVNIPKYGMDKLNAAYAYGKAKLAVKTIEDNYGIKIDNYITVGFSDFEEIIDTLGGIEIKLTADECGYINWQMGKNGQSGQIKEKNGVQKINGRQALWLCRDRGSEVYFGDDFTRTSRQRRLLKAIVNAYDSASSVEIMKLLPKLKKLVTTDLKKEDLAWLANNTPSFAKYTVKDKCIPAAKAGWQQGNSEVGAWVIHINNWTDTRSDLAEFIYSDVKLR